VDAGLIKENGSQQREGSEDGKGFEDAAKTG
jgi:hypothetical protein